ncbi:tryptophan 7-halogenase [Sphingomonas koreensis]|nr:tryptophan 7-halogenase [Sphingomonas koreensis]
MSAPIARIAVFGGGLVGLSAATAFAHALRGTQVELIATPADPAALADRMPGTIPSIRTFNDAIGFPEPEMIRGAGAIHRLAIRFENWAADGAEWLHGYGQFGPRGVANFAAQWAIASAGGDQTPLHKHHMGAALAAAERFAPPSEDPRSPLADFTYALTIDPSGYHAGLSALAEHRRIASSHGAIGAVERGENGRIVSVALADGRSIVADLFIDATGPSALLLSQLDDSFERWSDVLPCDRLLLARAPPSLSLVETVTALDCGWRWRAPGRRASSLGLAYASALTPEDEALHHFGPAPEESVAFCPGRRPHSWIGNVLAIGDAAVAVDPLEATNLHLAHSAILRAIELLPTRNFAPPLIAEYNRRTRDETIRVRDFLAAHYCRSGRRRGAFWRAASAARLPESLARTLDLFEARGRLPHFEEESFRDEDWKAVLLGMGVIPARPDPVALVMTDHDRTELLRTTEQRIAAIAVAAPTYREVLMTNSRLPPSTHGI